MKPCNTELRTRPKPFRNSSLFLSNFVMPPKQHHWLRLQRFYPALSLNIRRLSGWRKMGNICQVTNINLHRYLVKKLLGHDVIWTCPSAVLVCQRNSKNPGYQTTKHMRLVAAASRKFWAITNNPKYNFKHKKLPSVSKCDKILAIGNYGRWL